MAPLRRNIALLGRNKEDENLLNEKGYDSDGGNGLSIDTVVNDINIDDYSEETMPTEIDPFIIPVTTEAGTDDGVDTSAVAIEEEDSYPEVNLTGSDLSLKKYA